ncbi:MAG: hypothetical protein IT330_04990 [Anaerolineae bacterium]|nr:hypothetical protein [Anaerolineae bacterium]
MLGYRTRAAASLVAVLFLSGCAALVQHPAPRLESDVRQLRLAEAWQDIAAYGEFNAKDALTNHFQIVWGADGQLEHFYLPFVVRTRKGEWTAAIADYLPVSQGGNSLRAYPLADAPDPAAYVPVIAALEEIDRQGLGSLAGDLGGKRRVLATFQVAGAALRFGPAEGFPAYTLRDGQKERGGQSEPYQVDEPVATLTLVPLSSGKGSEQGTMYLLWMRKEN